MVPAPIGFKEVWPVGAWITKLQIKYVNMSDKVEWLLTLRADPSKPLVWQKRRTNKDALCTPANSSDNNNNNSNSNSNSNTYHHHLRRQHSLCQRQPREMHRRCQSQPATASQHQHPRDSHHHQQQQHQHHHRHHHRHHHHHKHHLADDDHHHTVTCHHMPSSPPYHQLCYMCLIVVAALIILLVSGIKTPICLPVASYQLPPLYSSYLHTRHQHVTSSKRYDTI